MVSVRGGAVMIITKAKRADLEQILALQYLAYRSEAILLNDFSIQPLRQTIAEINKEYETCVFLKATDESGDIVGSVRAHIDDGTTYIGKLIVHPDRQGRGIGKKLLSSIERECSAKRYELFTSSKSIRNLQLYQRNGYVKFREQTESDELTFIFFEKYASQHI